jgi:hypothetical protein
MTEAEWLKTKIPLYMLREFPGEWDARKARLFWCACCRRYGLSSDERMRRLLEAAEDHSEADTTWFARRFPALFGLYRASDAGHVKFRHYLTLRGFFNTPPDSLLRFVEILAPSSARGTLLKAGQDPWSAECARPFNEAEGVVNNWLSAALREVFGNPFRPVALNPAWLTSDVLALARQMYESRDFGAMPILADALQEAGCDHINVLGHCREPGEHVRGCWVIDMLLGK